MKVGYIKINGSVSQIFLNEKDEVIQKRVTEIKDAMTAARISVDVTWDNQHSEKTVEDLLVFLGIR